MIVHVLSGWLASSYPIRRAFLQHIRKKGKRYSQLFSQYYGEIVGFTERRTALTRAQSASLENQDFDLRVERAQKIP